MSVQFYGYNFGGTGVFHCFAFMHSFQKLVSDFGDFQTLCGANLGHPLWVSQSMQELASGMRNVLPFLITDAKSSIDCEPPDLQ